MLQAITAKISSSRFIILYLPPDTGVVSPTPLTNSVAVVAVDGIIVDLCVP